MKGLSQEEQEEVEAVVEKWNNEGAPEEQKQKFVNSLLAFKYTK